MEKKAASIIGIILGIAIIIVGFCVQGINVDADDHESYGTPTIGSYIKFGADFYTEMYAVTQDVGDAVNSANKNIHGAVNNAQRNICGAIEKACDAIGWLIVAIGLFDIAYFVCKMASCGENYSGNNYNAAPTKECEEKSKSKAEAELKAQREVTEKARQEAKEKAKEQSAVNTPDSIKKEPKPKEASREILPCPHCGEDLSFMGWDDTELHATLTCPLCGKEILLKQ
jgi:hypothetical protein